MSVPEFDALLEGMRYAAPRWTQVFGPDAGAYNAITGDRYEPLAWLLLAPYGYRTWATARQIGDHRLTVVDEPVDTFSVRIGHEHEHKRFIVPYRTKTRFPVVLPNAPRNPPMPFPAEACERALAKYGAFGALSRGYEEYALRALVGHVADAKIGKGVLRRIYVEELASTFALYMFGFGYVGVREDVIAETTAKLKPIEFAHDVATAVATASTVVEKLGVKRS